MVLNTIFIAKQIDLKHLIRHTKLSDGKTTFKRTNKPISADEICYLYPNYLFNVKYIKIPTIASHTRNIIFQTNLPYNVIAQSSPYLSAHVSSIAFDTIKGFLNHTTIIFKNIHPAFLHTKKAG